MRATPLMYNFRSYNIELKRLAFGGVQKEGRQKISSFIKVSS